MVEPPYASLPLSEQTGVTSSSNSIYSKIIFSVTPGLYNYTVEPYNFLPNSQGNVTITNHNVTVPIGPATVMCRVQTQNSAVTVTEVIVQNTVFVIQGCTEHSTVSNSTTFIARTSQTGNTTFTVTQLSNSTPLPPFRRLHSQPPSSMELL